MEISRENSFYYFLNRKQKFEGHDQILNIKQCEDNQNKI